MIREKKQSPSCASFLHNPLRQPPGVRWLPRLIGHVTTSGHHQLAGPGSRRPTVGVAWLSDARNTSSNRATLNGLSM